MWRIFFKYADESNITVTCQTKEISLELATKCYNEYGRNAKEAIYQKYPKKNNKPVSLYEKIRQLQLESSEVRK